MTALPVSIPFIVALVLLLCSVVWAIVTREIGASLFAIWSIAVIVVFSKWT
jgi:hypothetical protein